jgi:hypothetical protein
MRKQPLHFRQDEVQFVAQRWQHSESCSLVGVGSVGKSNLLHHLSNNDVHLHYLGQRASRFIAITIDPNLLGPIDPSASVPFKCWAGYELMMHRLYVAFYPLTILEDDAHNFFDTYQMLQDGTNPLYDYMGLRFFELGLEYFLRRDIQIVFMFDEFEELLRRMPPKFFQTLRGLRDNHKTKLSYLTFSREPLPVLIEKMRISEEELEPFTELFTDNVYYVGPYNQVDAQAMIERLIRRNPQSNYTSSAIDFLLYATGRYAGLMRAGFRSLDYIGDIPPSDVRNPYFVERLASRRPVRAECETIWKGLTDVEQRVLKTISQRHSEKPDAEAELAISLLVQKRLLRLDRSRQTLSVEPPVFNAFVANQQ